jgi:hypothetical protein
MPTFWLATFDGLSPGGVGPPAEPLVTGQGGPWAVEIIHLETPDAWAVLFSTVDDAANPTALTCRVGYVSDTKTCSVWRHRGFPLMEAAFVRASNGDLTLRSPSFGVSDEMDYQAELVTIGGWNLKPAEGTPAALSAPYVQTQETPDPIFPADRICQRRVIWPANRSNVLPVVGPLQIRAAAARWPSLTPFVGKVTPTAIWSGDIVQPDWTQASISRSITHSRRAATFGVPAFRFEDVEVLGFRLDLGRSADAASTCRALLEPLNFHLAGPGVSWSPGDFEYRAATCTLNLEILRYGKMRLKETSAPLTPEDFQSQHEFLVKILVGRVDDDTSQARDPAIYVPAIFVDNPWSKALGRDVQGFDKRLAEFCVRDGTNLQPLLPNGRLPGREAPEPLGSIRQIRLAGHAGHDPSGQVVLQLDYESVADWDDFWRLDRDLARGASRLGLRQWRQPDFSQREYSRSFARAAVGDTSTALRSIQASPIGESRFRRKWRGQSTLITSTFDITSPIQFARPQGVAKLTLAAPPPTGTRSTCRKAPGTG